MGPLPPSLRGSLETEVALLMPERPNSARPVAVKPRIIPGHLSRGETPPCLGFGKGTGPRGPLPPRLRGGLESKVTLFMPGVPNSARPAAVQPPISPASLSCSVTPPCLGFGEGTACVGPLPPSLRGSFKTEVALLKPERPNSARPVAV